MSKPNPTTTLHLTSTARLILQYFKQNPRIYYKIDDIKKNVKSEKGYRVEYDSAINEAMYYLGELKLIQTNQVPEYRYAQNIKDEIKTKKNILISVYKDFEECFDTPGNANQDVNNEENAEETTAKSQQPLIKTGRHKLYKMPTAALQKGSRKMTSSRKTMSSKSLSRRKSSVRSRNRTTSISKDRTRSRSMGRMRSKTAVRSGSRTRSKTPVTSSRPAISITPVGSSIGSQIITTNREGMTLPQCNLAYPTMLTRSQSKCRELLEKAREESSKRKEDDDDDDEEDEDDAEAD